MKATLLGVLVLVAVAFVAALDDSAGIPAWLELRNKLVNATGRVEELEAETRALRGQIDALEHEPFALERAIREDLVLALPGEVVVRFRREGEPGW